MTDTTRVLRIAYALSRAGYVIRAGWLDAGGHVWRHGLCIEAVQR